MSASLSGHKIKAEIRIDDLENAFLTVHASTQLDLAQVKPFINADTLEQLSGNLAMNVYYSGKLSQLQNVSKDKLYEVKAWAMSISVMLISNLKTIHLHSLT
ncbi:MAG: hypothetical protein IPP27_11650 [Bacteroidetes bacterium]|nr:hypothetical protein [Bacteroidota bacterium]